MRIAYFVKHYPGVGHSFIRREILELERQGMEAVRVALRGGSEPLVEADDLAERGKTHFLLTTGKAARRRALERHSIDTEASKLVHPFQAVA